MLRSSSQKMYGVVSVLDAVPRFFRIRIRKGLDRCLHGCI